MKIKLKWTFLSFAFVLFENKWPEIKIDFLFCNYLLFLIQGDDDGLNKIC